MIRIVACGLLALPCIVTAGTDEFAAKCTALAEKALAAGYPGIAGDTPEWLFLAADLRHTAAGAFWTKEWSITVANGQDPIPFLTGFHGALKAKGVELILVPVPAKSAIYPEKVSKGATTADVVSGRPFLESLRSKGMQVLDLEAAFQAEREAGQEMYCATDSHYSPAACQVVAKLIANQVRNRPWLAVVPRQALVRAEPAKLVIHGDLVPEAQKASIAEELTVVYAGREEQGRIVSVKQVDDSPVLVLGDSHTLVFHEGAEMGMHCQGAGLVDQLQVELGFPLSVVGVRGSGTKTARIQLYRRATSRPDYWSRKKLVIWCFAEREFTQSSERLIEIPLEKR